MARVTHSDVQVSSKIDTRTILREVSTRLRSIASTVNLNREYGSGPSQVSAMTATNGTVPVWISSDEFELVSVSAYVSSGTGSLTPRIDSVNVGGAAFSITTMPTVFSISSPNTISALGVLDMVTSGLTGNLLVSFNLRRLN